MSFGWRAGVLAFLVLALGLLPAAWFASRVDCLDESNDTDDSSQHIRDAGRGRHSAHKRLVYLLLIVLSALVLDRNYE